VRFKVTHFLSLTTLWPRLASRIFGAASSFDDDGIPSEPPASGSRDPCARSLGVTDFSVVVRLRICWDDEKRLSAKKPCTRQHPLRKEEVGSSDTDTLHSSFAVLADVQLDGTCRWAFGGHT
jgi:hypothetical protein